MTISCGCVRAPNRERKQAAAKPAAAGARAATSRDPLRRLRQRLDKVEASIAAVAAERRLLDAELAANPLHDKLKKRLENLARDAAYLEAQWMEIGTAIEAAET